MRAWSKWFGQYLRKLEIKDDASKVFHSFRHSFIDAMRTARINEELSLALVGHGKGSVHQAYGAKDMVRRFGMQSMAEAVSSVEYRGLDLSNILWGRGKS